MITLKTFISPSVLPKRLPPTASILTLIAAVCCAVLLLHTNSDAQSAGNSCGSPAFPAQLTGRIGAAKPGTSQTLIAFPRSKTGDAYLAQLKAGAGGTSVSGGQSATDMINSVSAQMNSSNALQQNLPGLYSSAYGISVKADNTFICGGLATGSWTLLAIQQANAPAATTGSPTPVPVAKMNLNTLNSLMANQKAYFYSWIIIGPDAKKPLPQPSPTKGQTPAPPAYPAVAAAPFKPIAQYPAGYFK